MAEVRDASRTVRQDPTSPGRLSEFGKADPPDEATDIVAPVAVPSYRSRLRAYGRPRSRCERVGLAGGSRWGPRCTAPGAGEEGSMTGQARRDGIARAASARLGAREGARP